MRDLNSAIFKGAAICRTTYETLRLPYKRKNENKEICPKSLTF